MINSFAIECLGFQIPSRLKNIEKEIEVKNSLEYGMAMEAGLAWGGIDEDGEPNYIGDYKKWDRFKLIKENYQHSDKRFPYNDNWLKKIN